MYCGQTVGRIKMKLGTQVGLGPGHSVLGGDPASASPKGGAEPPIFGTYPLWSNGWMDQDATWYGSRPRPRRLCVRWGPYSPAEKGAQPSPPRSAHVYCGQMAGWIKMALGMEIGLSPCDLVLHGDHPLLKKGAEPPIFGACLLWPNGWMDQDSTCLLYTSPSPRD